MRTLALTRTSSRRWFIVLAATLAILAGACGSSSDPAAAPELASIDEPADAATVADGDEPDVAETPKAVDPEQAFAEFEACMADHGVTVAIGGPGGAPVDDLDPSSEPAQEVTPADLEAAEAECEPILDNAFASFDLSPEQEAERADELLEVQQCLAEAGFEIDMSGGRFQVPQDVDFDEFNIAMKDCASLGAVGGGSQP